MSKAMKMKYVGIVFSVVVNIELYLILLISA